MIYANNILIPAPSKMGIRYWFLRLLGGKPMKQPIFQLELSPKERIFMILQGVNLSPQQADELIAFVRSRVRI